ncbi:hypothetical protein [Glycocaulis albus]|uniref:hypothetical protein n=1 Tax=Glycocaulis albus TaxID=1382801 RepID=UPI001669A0A4|nr:hypothetical protein [Glycocaulis albus]
MFALYLLQKGHQSGRQPPQFRMPHKKNRPGALLRAGLAFGFVGICDSPERTPNFR